MSDENVSGTERLNRKETTVRLIPLLVLSLLFLISGIILFHSQFTVISVITVIVEAVVAGFGEELIFRLIILGLCFKFLKESKHVPAVIVVSVLFGLAHFANLRGGSFEFSMVLFQVVAAGVAGLMFGFIFYNSRSYWLCAGVHFLYDLGVFTISIGVGNLTLAGVGDLISELLIIALCGLIIASLVKTSAKFLRIEMILGLILAVTITVLKFIAYSAL
ncbi:MAG: CPBP family intramembrane metalloprotease [Lachnospiraceae bacterium]|nr:CPBP family intramembrane metalloprotease [Lachnospiraceae bacterium]